MRTPAETAEFMIERYGNKKRAMEMAMHHAHSYTKDDPRQAYWEKVLEELKG